MDFSQHSKIDYVSGEIDKPLLIKELKVTVSNFINKLPDHLKYPLIYFYYDELKYSEIANKMNIPIGTVYPAGMRIASKRSIFIGVSSTTNTLQGICFIGTLIISNLNDFEPMMFTVSETL